jgi:TPR repeat protein
MLRSKVTSNPNDQATALTLAKKLVLAADVLTPMIAEQKQRNKAREKYVMESHKLLKKLTSLNNSDAMFFLADCYGRGALGLETSPSNAFALYQSAAKAGHAAAAYRTAVCCEIGQDEGGGTRKDPLKAVQWYKRAATLGDVAGMYKMGMVLLKGLLGQRKDLREAVQWLKRAAERADAENPHALHELALLYSAPQSGESSIVRDEGYAVELFRQGAELGYKFSQFRLGRAYEQGEMGLPMDAKASITWYSKAAVQEEHQSELALSGWYLTGYNDPRTGAVVLAQSDTEAYLWARKAAVAGLPRAEFAMGYFLEEGIGCPRDVEGAKRWYWRAAGMYFVVEQSDTVGLVDDSG